jgi:hypothetical protein
LTAAIGGDWLNHYEAIGLEPSARLLGLLLRDRRFKFSASLFPGLAREGLARGLKSPERALGVEVG